MGQDAIILAEWQADGAYELRAGIERSTQKVAPTFQLNANPRPASTLKLSRYRERLKEILVWHGAPEGFADIIANSGSRLVGASDDPAAGFSTALEGIVGFSPVAPSLKDPIMLVGPPGSGKTSTTAKLIRRARAANSRAIPLVADFDATAGDAQLAAYLRRKASSIHAFESPDGLLGALEIGREKGVGMVIDTPPINPNDGEDLERLRDLINLVDAEPVLVISAEGHPLELDDNVRAFAELGITRCIVTKLDVVRRRGSILSAIAGARMNLSHLAMTPFIGGGLLPATPNRLARILLEEAPGAETLKGAA
jgi:flagellar biosynthesis protein FlhF